MLTAFEDDCSLLLQKPSPCSSFLSLPTAGQIWKGEKKFWLCLFDFVSTGHSLQ